MMAMLEKPEGGFRPIGLLCTLIRVWGRFSRSVARAWEGINKRSYFYGRSGKSCERGVWKRAFVA
eukprot:333557-Pyramimonas_sp.AAC.1